MMQTSMVTYQKLNKMRTETSEQPIRRKRSNRGTGREMEKSGRARFPLRLPYALYLYNEYMVIVSVCVCNSISFVIISYVFNSFSCCCLLVAAIKHTHMRNAETHARTHRAQQMEATVFLVFVNASYIALTRCGGLVAIRISVSLSLKRHICVHSRFIIPNSFNPFWSSIAFDLYTVHTCTQRVHTQTNSLRTDRNGIHFVQGQRTIHSAQQNTKNHTHVHWRAGL